MSSTLNASVSVSPGSLPQAPTRQDTRRFKCCLKLLHEVGGLARGLVPLCENSPRMGLPPSLCPPHLASAMGLPLLGKGLWAEILLEKFSASGAARLPCTREDPALTEQICSAALGCQSADLQHVSSVPRASLPLPWCRAVFGDAASLSLQGRIVLTGFG